MIPDKIYFPYITDEFHPCFSSEICLQFLCAMLQILADKVIQVKFIQTRKLSLHFYFKHKIKFWL